VIDYCLLLEKVTLPAIIGCFLEQRKGAFEVSEEQISRLLSAKPKVPQYASKRGRGKFELIKKWNILLPLQVISQS